MKTLLTLLAAVTSLLFCLTAPAQTKPATSDAKPKPASDAVKDPDPWKRRLPEVQFDNVPLSEVANYLSEQFPEVNFVLDPSVKDKSVVLKLRSVTLEDIFTALSIGTQNVGQTIDPATGIPAPGGAVQVNKLTERMVSFAYGQPDVPYVVKSVCRAFSLSRNLAGKSDKEIDQALVEIEEALQIAWKMLQAADQSKAKVQPPQLSLHRATKLLIVVGKPDQVNVVEQVISQLESGTDPLGAGVRPSVPPLSPSLNSLPRTR